MHHWLHRLSLVLCCTTLAACAPWLAPASPSQPRSIELSEVPFFPQAKYQCGPAALATVLNFSGLNVDSETLESAVYLPKREGSLQAELLAASRRYERIPYRIPGTLDALQQELLAGNPVLIMQNLGIDVLPRWHYAVVVGYQAEHNSWVLRSGTKQRSIESAASFWRRWSKAGNWALVTKPAGELAATVEARAALQALADVESMLSAQQAQQAWEAALLRWPEEADLQFATANARRRRGLIADAAALYRQLIKQQPDHLAAHNNYADLLLEAGCPYQAELTLNAALKYQNSTALMSATLHKTAEEIQAALQQKPAEANCPIN